MYSAYTKEQVKSFVDTYGNSIVRAITDQDLYFATVVAQLTVESQWAQSKLSTQYNNYGGIKNTGSMYSSGSVVLDTTEVSAGREIAAKGAFATYDDFDKFMADYVRVLHLPQYLSAGVYSAPDPYKQLLAIGQGGYSTRNPQQYLDFGKSRIEACLDMYPWGKISSGAPTPAIQPKGPLAAAAATVNGVLDKAFAGMGAKTYQPVL
jgi:hypothetical protein